MPDNLGLEVENSLRERLRPENARQPEVGMREN